jgi:hypothetical protein
VALSCWPRHRQRIQTEKRLLPGTTLGNLAARRPTARWQTACVQRPPATDRSRCLAVAQVNPSKYRAGFSSAGGKSVLANCSATHRSFSTPIGRLSAVPLAFAVLWPGGRADGLGDDCTSHETLAQATHHSLALMLHNILSIVAHDSLAKEPLWPPKPPHSGGWPSR